ncbi:MAG: hypothetical protein AAF561_07830 [Planctomycetota bacterium]
MSVSGENLQAEALANLQANARALVRVDGQQWNDLATGGFGPGVTWLRGRDGSLTARVGDRWLGGSLLPTRVGQRLTKEFDASHGAILLVAPNHLAHVHAIVDRLEIGQSLFVVWPDVRSLRLALGCGDVSDAISCGKVACFAGTHDLAASARRQRGRVLPRTLHLCGDAEAVQGPKVHELLAQAKSALEASAAWQASEVQRRVEQPAIDVEGPVLIAAGSGFRLLADAGRQLTSALAGLGERVLDLDDPRHASPLALADATAGVSALVTADVLRRDLPGVVPTLLPWVTWISQHRTPVAPINDLDHVVLAEASWREAWQAAGWRSDQIAIAGWSGTRRTGGDGGGRGVLVAFDLPTDDTLPASVGEFSSQRVSWENMANELANRPYSLVEAGGRDAYLIGRLRASGVDPADVDRGLWQARLVTPSFVRGIGKLARRAGATLAGSGWPDARDASAAVAFDGLLDRHAVLLDPTPEGHPAVAGQGLPVLRAASLDPQQLARRIREARGQRPQASDLAGAIRSRLTGGARRLAA